MKEILIITNYYPPETGAASNRIFHLAEGLQQRDFKVHVITPLPNYPTGRIFDDYKGRFKKTSTENSITIHRLWIYASNSKNKMLRLFAMLSYSFSLIWFFIWNKIPKIVIIQSPPLLVAYTSLLFLKSKKRKIILNVSDLWPLAGLELGVFKKGISYKLLEKIEYFNYRRADLVLGQSEEILIHVTSKLPGKKTFLYRNFPDFIPPKIEPVNSDSEKIRLVYAGLLGVAQGIYKLIKSLDYNNIEFHIYGNGNQKENIDIYLKNNPGLPVFYHGEVSRDKLHKELMQYDLTIIPLLNRIYGSVPSKIFEYAKLGLPILYFGGGEGEKIVKSHKLGWVVNVSNYIILNNILSQLDKNDLTIELKESIQRVAKVDFDFNTQIETLIGCI